MKTILTLAFVLAAGLASATELKVPKGKTAMAKSPPPVVIPTAGSRDACLANVTSECEAKNWTKLGKMACYRVKSRKCR